MWVNRIIIGIHIYYSKGENDIPQSIEKAVHFYQMAANHDDPDAQLNLWAMYAKV